MGSYNLTTKAKYLFKNKA